MPVRKKLGLKTCVSSTFQEVGLGPNFDWSQVVSCGRSGPALRPIFTLSLFQAEPEAEFAAVICALILTFDSSRIVLSLKSDTVKRSISGLA